MANLTLVNATYGFPRWPSSSSDPVRSVANGDLAILNMGELGPWTASRAVTAGQQGCNVAGPGAKQIKALTSGTTGGTIPTFPAVGGAVVDDGVTWQVIAQAPATEDSGGTGGWGYLTIGSSGIRIPDDAQPQGGTDGWLVLDDDVARTRFCLWRASRQTTGGSVTPGTSVFSDTFASLGAGWTVDSNYTGPVSVSGGKLVLTTAGSLWSSNAVLRRTSAEFDTGAVLVSGYEVPNPTGYWELILDRAQTSSFPDDSYALKVKNGGIDVVARKGGVETTLATTTSAPAAGTTADVRFVITAEGSARRIRARWWQSGTTEPYGTWHVNALDSTSPITGSGYFRVQGGANVTDSAITYRVAAIDVAQSITEVAPTVTGWTCAWGAEFPYDEDGRSPSPDYNSPRVWPQEIRGRGTGPGIAMGLGAITLDDFARFEAGLPLNHALGSATDLCQGPANTAGKWRFPAVTTDGWKTTGVTIQEGTRLQLDPSIDVDAISGITPFEAWVAKALQTYGTYITDSTGNGGARLTVAVEIARTDEQRAYYDTLGIGGTFTALTHIPLSSMRALATWNGA